MNKETLIKALEITQQHLPGSDLEKKLQKQVETIIEMEEKKRYIRMLSENRFSSREQVENLCLLFNDDLLFLYDNTHFAPTQQEAERYRELSKLHDCLKATVFQADLTTIEEELLIYEFKRSMSEHSWDEVVDSLSPHVDSNTPTYTNMVRRVESLLGLIR